jgi:hypothetical protein
MKLRYRRGKCDRYKTGGGIYKHRCGTGKTGMKYSGGADGRL